MHWAVQNTTRGYHIDHCQSQTDARRLRAQSTALLKTFQYGERQVVADQRPILRSPLRRSTKRRAHWAMHSSPSNRKSNEANCKRASAKRPPSLGAAFFFARTNGARNPDKYRTNA